MNGDTARPGWRLAVDVGTTNTAAALQAGDQAPRPVRLSDQADQMPSAVLAGQQGLLVGAEAVRSARIDPSAFEPCPKRRIGDGQMQLGTAEVPVATAIATILRHVFVRANRISGGGHPQEIVLTCPEQWQQARRQVLVDAARSAGYHGPVRLLSEPIAAAGHYATRTSVPAGALVAVFDFGGGTCDVAVLRAEGTGAATPFTVLAADGIDPLGGEDLDVLLADWTTRKLRETGQEDLVTALQEPAALGDRLTFRDQVRNAKQALTDWESTRIPVAAAGRQAVVTITAEEFDALIAPRIDDAVELTRRTLQRAGVGGPDLHALYLTGGSSHLRLVQRRLAELIQRPPATLEDPKLVVALGALAAPTPATDEPVTAEHRVPAGPVPVDPWQGPPAADPWQQGGITNQGPLNPVAGGGVPPNQGQQGGGPHQGPPNTGPQGGGWTPGNGPVAWPPSDGGPQKPKPAAWIRPVSIAGLVLVVLLLGASYAVSTFTGANRKNPPTPSPRSPTPTPSSLGPSSPGPSSPGPSSPGPSRPGAAGCGSLPAAECTLARQLPADYVDLASCTRVPPANADNVATVSCTTPASARVGANPGVRIFATRYATLAAMNGWVESVAGTNKLTATDQGCFDLTGPGRNRWRPAGSDQVIGTVLCYPADGAANVMWSYENDRILMATVANGPDVPALMRWWADPNRSAILQ